MADEFTVEIARDGGAPPNSRTYSVVFRANGVRESAEHLRRCRSDYALLRVIEELVAAPEARLELLERLRAEGRVSIPRIALTDVQAAKYGLAKLASSQSGDPICPVCSRSVSIDERLIFRDGQAIHDECRLRSRDMTDDVARFLEQTPGRALCHTCLSSLFSVGFDEARKVVGRLHVRQRYAVTPAPCSVCHKLRVAIRALPDPDA